MYVVYGDDNDDGDDDRKTTTTTIINFMAITQVNRCYMTPTVKNWRILLVQSITA